MKKAKNGDTVKVNYMGKLDDGTIFDSSSGKDPLHFTIGQSSLIPAFEEGIVGLAEGESKTIQIPAEDAFGLRQEKLVGKIPVEQLPEDLNPEVGMKLQMKTPDEKSIPITVVEVSDNDITIDANHELAGEDLNFEIELVEIVS